MTVNRWQNWSGAVQFTPAQVHTPSTLDQIVTIVKKCAAEGVKLRVVGAGHSFTPLVQTDGVLLSLDNYSGLEAIDREACTAKVKAGTRIKALGDLLFEHGLAMENLGDIDVQTIAGAISTGTHGTGVNYGSISTQVIGLTLVTADGSVVECSETQNRALFKAAQVSLGALGVIVSVTLRAMPAYTLRLENCRTTLEKCLANLDDYKRNHRHFEFYWIPHTDAVQTRCTDLTDETPKSKSLVRRFNEYAIENGALWLFSAFNRQFPAASARVSKMMANFIGESWDVNHAHKVFASVRLVKFQEMEYNLPAENFAAALTEIDATIKREKHRVHFPVECRFVHSDDIPLSPANGRESAYIAVHMFKGMEYRRYFDALEPIFLKYGGRPHWGKMHTQTAASLQPRYPQWADFQAARDQLDPNRLFTTPYLAALLGE